MWAYAQSQAMNKRKPSKIALKTVLIVPFIAQISIAVGLTSYFSLRNGQESVNALALKLRKEVSDRINQHLDSYLRTPQQVAQLNADAIRFGAIDPNDFQKSGRLLRRQIETFNLGYIGYGFISGEFTGAGYGHPNIISIGKKTKDTNNKIYYYKSDKNGNWFEKFDQASYEFFDESWFKALMVHGKPIWTEVYA